MQKPADSASVDQFLDWVVKFQGFLKTNVKQSVVVARNRHDSSDAAVNSTLQDAEKHLLFKPSELKQWLKRKTEEMDIAYWMEKAAGTGIEFISKDKLENHLRNSSDYSVVFFVPEERTSVILAAMKSCSGNLEEFGICGYKGKDDGQSWYNNPLQKELVLVKIQELVAHVKRNKNNISKPVNYIVSFSGSSKPLTCSYSVYKGAELLKGKIGRLPGEPTGLSVFSLPSANTRQSKRAKSSTSSIRLEWDYGVIGFPFSFVVEYRSAGSSDSWAQQKTENSEVLINFETGTDVEMRVAAETCIDRSEFSAIVDTASAVELPELDIPSVVLPPTGLKVKSVTSETAELEWITPTDRQLYFDLWFRVNYLEKGQEPSDTDFQEYSYSETPRILHGLKPETTYCITISTVTADGSNKSAPSCVPVEFTTGQKVRFAVTFAEQNENCKSEVYSVPLIEWKGKDKSEDPFLWSDVVDCKLVTCGPFKEHEQNRHKFNSSAILSSKLQSDSNCFDEWMKNMAEFLNFSLGGVETKLAIFDFEI